MKKDKYDYAIENGLVIVDEEGGEKPCLEQHEMPPGIDIEDIMPEKDKKRTA